MVGRRRRGAGRAAGRRPGRRRARGAAGRRVSPTRCAPRGIACFGPDPRGRPARGLQGVRQGRDGRGRRADRGRPACARPRAEAEAALDEFGAPYVVKDDGLAAGKGVVVTDDREAALAHAVACERVVIEEFLDGPEVSLFALCSWNEADGATVYPLQPAQDFKRIFDGDEGPNTGGMGAYTPLPWAPDGLVAEVLRDVLQPTVDEMARRGTPFAGLLYAGLALTAPRHPRRRVQRPVRRPGDPAAARPPRLAAGAAAPCRRDRPPGRRRPAGRGSRARRSRWSWPAAATPSRRRPATSSPVSRRPRRSTASTSSTPAPPRRTATWSPPAAACSRSSRPGRTCAERTRAGLRRRPPASDFDGAQFRSDIARPLSRRTMEP